MIRDAPKFPQKIDSQVPEHPDVHLICSNYGTHKSPAVRRWPGSHPRFHMHHTPTYASWINQVERWFAYLTDDLLRCSGRRLCAGCARGGIDRTLANAELGGDL